ncbi:MAG TPA: TonB family protein, partial [Bdellovibrionales bacterium]|nr:TonB family protein [Bdellovibrionales bacterium]
LAIGMAGFEAVKVIMPETEMELLPAPQGGSTQEVQIVETEPLKVADAKPAELPKTLPQKSEQQEAVKPVEKKAPAVKPVSKPKAKAIVQQPPATLPEKSETPAETPIETVEDSPVAITENKIEETSLEEKALEDAAETEPVPAIAESTSSQIKEEKVETADPQEKFVPAPAEEQAKTEAAAPAQNIPDDGEDWTKEIKAAALPTAHASEPPAQSAGVANSRFQQGNVRSESELTPKKGNPQAIYPQMERLKRVEGTAVIRFNVDGNGNVVNAWLHSTSGSKAIDQEALRTQKSWKYQPGKQGTFQKPWVFRLKGEPEEIPYFRR